MYPVKKAHHSYLLLMFLFYPQCTGGPSQNHVLHGVSGANVCGSYASPGVEAVLHQGQSHN